MVRTLSALLAFLAIGFAVSADKPAAKNGVADAIPLVKEDKIEVKSGKWNEPSLVKTEDELKKLIPDEATHKRLMKEVDFKTHVLLVFSWRGSGQDKIEVAILESFPEQVKFTRKEGRSDDLQSLVKLFAVKKESKWSAK